MPRPSLKKERQQQIIDACERCIIRYGIAGVTLEQIAEEAGIARALIRHNLGNRDDVIKAVTQRFVENGDKISGMMLQRQPRNQPFTNLVQGLFKPNKTDQTAVQLATALTLAAIDDPVIASVVMTWNEKFFDQLAVIAQKQFPKASKATCEAVSIGIAGIWSNYVCLAPLSPPDKVAQSSLVSALMLIAMLEIENGPS